MIVNIDQANYVKDAGETAGIRLVVHPGNRMPFPEDEGMTVSPGHSTSIGLQKVRSQLITSVIIIIITRGGRGRYIENIIDISSISIYR